MRREFFDLAGQVLDHELLDADDYPCGHVDDIEIEAVRGETPSVKALLVGPGAWIARLPRVLVPIFRWLFGREIVRVPWDEVAEIAAKIKLRSPASTLGLGKAERKAEHW